MDTLMSTLHADLLGRLLLAAVLGGSIGLERELSGKPAGLRTNLLICVGAALLADISIRFPSLATGDLARPDPARIAAQIVSGVGFLGAGTIIQARGSVTGLTTAATLWVVSAIGMAAGSGFHVEATGSAVLVLIALVPLGRLEVWLHDRRAVRGLTLVVSAGPGMTEEMWSLLADAGLNVFTNEVTRDVDEGTLTLKLSATGSADAFRRARQRLAESDALRSFSLRIESD